MLLIRNFNQKFSVRKTEELGSPRIIPLEKLQIPRGSVYHNIDLDRTTIAPPVTMPFFKELEKPAMVRHHYRLTDTGTIGRPISVPIQGQEKEILSYHRNNKRFRRMKNDDELVQRDLKVLLIENYTPMLVHYRYPDTQLAWYERLHNVILTVAQQIAEDAKNYPRQNYFILNLGNELPAYDKFKQTYNERTKTKLERFHDYTLQWLLEIFSWAISDGQAGVFEGLDYTQLSRINFIFTHNTGFTNVNLGVVEKMRKSNKGRLTNDAVSRKLYKTWMLLMTTQPHQLDELEYVDPHGDDVNIDLPEPVEEEEAIDEDEDEELVQAAEEDVAEFDEDEDLVIKAPVEDVKPTTIVIEKKIDHQQIIKKRVEELADAGRVTAKAFKFLNESADNFVNLPNPYNPKETYAEGMKLTPDDVKVKPVKKIINPVVMDDAWTQNTTDAMTEQYNKVVLPKDILGAVASAQRLGLVVHKHEIEKKVSVTGAMENHVLRVQPVGGEPVTVRFQTPILTDDGTWVANGVEYTMRRQRVDMPIRKVAPDTVALTTAYGKNFVRRSDKVANDYGRWLANSVITLAVNPKVTEISNAKLANVFNPSYHLPRHYTMLAQRISTFNGAGYNWFFDIGSIDKNFSPENVDAAKKLNLTPVAEQPRSKKFIAMDSHNQLYQVKGDKMDALGTLPEFIGLDMTGSKREMTELSIMGQSLSLGLVFSYYLGVQGMLKHFKIPFDVIPQGSRIDKASYDSILRLADAKIAIRCDTDEQRAIVHGLDRYVKTMVQYTESEMEREDVYLNLIRDVDKLSARYLKELTMMRGAFVDDMHARVLEKMGEPVTFIGLLERSNEMLKDDQSKPEINGDEMMFPGNQRIAYHLYTALVRSMRNYNNAPGSNRKFELTQDMVWGAINSDPSVLLAPGANPIQCIKEKDVTTLGGSGGRNRRTMVYHTREFQKSDIGIMSGNTVDNGDVGITAFLTNNPAFDTVDGTPAKRDYDKLNAGQLYSFVDGLVPDTLIDDGKRRNFVGIQMGSAMACDGARVTPYRTELEKEVGVRTSVKHARYAQQDCKVIEKSDNHIKVRYKDGSEEAFPLGRWFGAHEGVYYPHTVVSRWKVGDKLPVGSNLTYNEQHFEPDWYDPTQVNWKNGLPLRLILVEGEDVIEDSCSISKETSIKFGAEVTKIKDVTIRYDQVLLDILKEGDHCDIDTILCTFTDNLTGDVSGHSKEAAETLRALSAYSPSSGVLGYVDNIEIVYHGEIEDMSESLQAIVKKYDRKRRIKSLAVGRGEPQAGNVDGDFRVEGVPLAYNNLVIRFYITHHVPMAGSDKLVIANQLKTTVFDVMPGDNFTEDGVPYDGRFGRNSVDARIVASIQRIGTTNTVAIKAGHYVGEILDGKPAPKLPAKV